MRFIQSTLKRFAALLLIAVTFGQTLMPAEIAYARANNPSRFVLSLKDMWKQDINQRQANLIFRTLHLFPESFYKSLNHITLQFKNSHGPRGRANGSRIVLEAGRMSDPEMLAVFIHELAHVYDLGAAKGSGRSGPSRFKFKGGQYVRADDPSIKFYDIAWQSSDRHRRGINRHKHFASTYGASSPFEDFGEAFAFYVLHGDEFLRRAKSNEVMRKKYEHLWIRVFRGQRFAFGSRKQYPNSFFDVTKLPYNFARMLAYADQKRRALAREANDNRRKRSRKRNRLQRQARVRLRPLASGY